MTKLFDRGDLSRRALLHRLAAGLAAGLTVSQAFAQDDTLQALIDQNQGNDFGQSFDAGSRTIQMPKASLPTLSPATVQHTEQAMAQFEGIVANGGWPEVAQSDRLRLGSRHPAVIALRQRSPSRATSTSTPGCPTSMIPTSRPASSASRPAAASWWTASPATRR